MCGLFDCTWPHCGGPAILPLLGLGMGVIVLQWVTGSPPPSSSCAPCPHRSWYHMRTLSPSLVVPLAHLVPITYDTTCAPCPHCLWYYSGRWWGGPRQACCLWSTNLKGCVFGPNGLRLSVSYNPPPPRSLWVPVWALWVVCRCFGVDGLLRMVIHTYKGINLLGYVGGSNDWYHLPHGGDFCACHLLEFVLDESCLLVFWAP